MPDVEAPYKEARTRFERILNLKGIDLLHEWGICGDDIKLIKRIKTNALEEDKTRHEDTNMHELNIDENDRSFCQSSISIRK